KTTQWVDCCDCCFDPCTCQSVTKHKKCKVCCEGCPETRTRKVWHEHVVCEQVPCTTYVTECVVEKVPYTVCKKVPHTVVKKVPVALTLILPGSLNACWPVTVSTSVEEKWVMKVAYCVHSMEQYTVCKQVPYTVSKQVPYTVCKQVPYTVTEMVPTTVCKR